MSEPLAVVRRAFVPTSRFYLLQRFLDQEIGIWSSEAAWLFPFMTLWYGRCTWREMARAF